jgi:hypothetical protein
MFVTPGQNGPLYFLLLRPWLDLVGRTEFGLRFLSVIAGVLAVPLSYSLCRRLFPGRLSIGLIASLLAATNPYLIWYSQEGKMYALVVSLVLLSMDRYLAAVQEGGWKRWVVYVVVTSAALYVHLTTALLVLVQLIGYPLAAGGRWRQARPQWLVSLLAVVLAYLPLIAWEIPLLAGGTNTGYSFVALHDMGRALLVSYSLGVVTTGPLWLLAPSICLLIAGLLLKDSKTSTRAVALVVIWLVVPVVVFFGITLVRPMFTARYLVLVLPPYVVLLALGLVSVAGHARPAAILLLGCLLAANGWALYEQLTTPIKTDFRAAAHHIQERLNPTDLLVFQIPHGRYAFEYYTQSSRDNDGNRALLGEHHLFLPLVSGSGRAESRWVDGLYTNGGMEISEASVRMERLVGDADVIWLLATEVDLWDKRAIVQSWLEEHATLVQKTDFVGVTTFRYERQ